MKKITGVMVYYFFVCKRKLWFFTNDMTMEHNSDLVSIGKLIDENTYDRQKKNILIDETINIDFLRDWKVIHEIKKSRKIEEASKWQIKYYMWVLKEKGVVIKKGVLDYPLLRKRESIILEDDDEKQIKDILDDIHKILSLKLPPEGMKKAVCKKCAYYEFCYI